MVTTAVITPTRHALQQLGEVQRVQELESWSRNLRRPAATTIHTPARVAPSMPLPQPLGAPLWSRQDASDNPVGWSRRRIDAVRSHQESSQYAGTFPTPVAVGDVLYTHEGQRVVALDRSSGRPLWSYPPQEDPPTEAHPHRTRAETSARPMQGVVVVGDRIAANLSETAAADGRRPQQSVNNKLVCLDRFDGRMLWASSPGQLDPSVLDAVFDGEPISTGGRLYGVLKRTQPSGFQDIHIVAVSVDDGRLLWRRHLSSASTTLTAMRRVTMTIGDHGELYVCDNLGCVTAINSRNGGIHWMTLLDDRPDALRVTKAQAHVTLAHRQVSARSWPKPGWSSARSWACRTTTCLTRLRVGCGVNLAARRGQTLLMSEASWATCW